MDIVMGVMKLEEDKVKWRQFKGCGRNRFIFCFSPPCDVQKPNGSNTQKKEGKKKAAVPERMLIGQVLL